MQNEMKTDVVSEELIIQESSIAGENMWWDEKEIWIVQDEWIQSESQEDIVWELTQDNDKLLWDIVDNGSIKKPSSVYSTQSTYTPEIPKDYDASRNIGQWHSRDDIVRDKFDKHLQKIRYESWILKQRNDMLGYEKKLVEWLTLLPTDKDFQRQLADLYFHQWKYKKSQSLLKKILIDMPEDHYALWQVWEIALTEWHIEDAFVHFQQAYSYCEDNPKYCFSLAQRYYDADDLEQSLPLMEKMIKLRPKSIEYLVSLSHVQHKMWLRDNAKQSLLRALELDPMNIAIKQYLKSL